MAGAAALEEQRKAEEHAREARRARQQAEEQRNLAQGYRDNWR